MDVWWEEVPQVMDGQGEACRAHSSQTGGYHNEMEKRIQKFREVLKSKVSDCLESWEQNFEINTILNQKPVKLLKDKHDVVNGRAGDGASSRAQDLWMNVNTRRRQYCWVRRMEAINVTKIKVRREDGRTVRRQG